MEEAFSEKGGKGGKGGAFTSQVDFITHTFNLYTLSDRYQHRGSLITKK